MRSQPSGMQQPQPVMMIFEAYTADTFTVTADTSFDEIELPDGSYSMVYEMRDAMDNYAYSDAVIFDCADGEIQTTVFTE